MTVGAFVLRGLTSWALSTLLPFWTAAAVVGGIAAVVAGAWYTVSHMRYARGLKDYTFWQTLHFTALKMKFYDPHLDNGVWYARHALSLDENRKDFAIVKWGSKSNNGPPPKNTDPEWLQQVWFAGNHSDVGGSYLENESRLSDISLKWMVHAAVNFPDANKPNGQGLKVSPLLLQPARSAARRARAGLPLGHPLAEGTAARRFGSRLAFVRLCPRRGQTGAALLRVRGAFSGEFGGACKVSGGEGGRAEAAVRQRRRRAGSLRRLVFSLTQLHGTLQ